MIDNHFILRSGTNYHIIKIGKSDRWKVISACGQDLSHDVLLSATNQINQAAVAIDHIRQPRVIDPSWPTLSNTPDILSHPSSLWGILSFFNPFHLREKPDQNEFRASGSEIVTVLPWQVKNFTFDTLGNPKPIEFILDGDPTAAHKISVVDIDRKDVRMAIYLDNVLIGLTTAIEPDPKQDCGHDLSRCLHMGFSAGAAHILPGNHIVRIEPFRQQRDCDDCE